MAGYIYYGNTSTSLYLDQPTKWRTESLEKLTDISLDLAKLDARLNSLEVFGEYPVTPNITGRINIFAPF